MPYSPEAPQNVFCIKRHNYAIIKWDPVQFDTTYTLTLTATAYEVYRAANSNGIDYNVVATITHTVTGTHIASIYTDINIQTDEPYFYKVRAFVETTACITITVSEFSPEVSAVYFGDLLSVNKEPAQYAAARFDESYWDVNLYG